MELSAGVQIQELVNDPNALQIERLNINGVTISLVSCDHQPELMPEVDPWQAIEGEIQKSSLVFVEYFPYELESSVYNNPIWGKLAKDAGEAKGLNSFFNKVSGLATKYGREIAVSDIANGPMYSIYHGGLRFALSPLLISVDPGKFGSFLAFCSMLNGVGMNIQEVLRIGAFDLERKKFEKFIIDMEDARRLLIAKGIRQEAERRNEGSQLSYIAPRTHVSRVKWYLEHPDDIVSNTKAKVYSLAIGLPRSTRIYKNSKKFHSWQLVSDTPIKV
ncbi:MAG TPA: hypothetical protein DIU47_01430 [Candidatus Pacebacteria bacterium]|nr:MAG: hypothetical protein UX00_C0002G0006 [Microgenomates group bacterium GW2011_GWB1_45_17]HBB43906.1 hypothetical protein [Candidatus Yonathbacteria bacterium]HCR92600.1 hypothetical protein [Candidatus Paceibacterota bacterium]